MRSARRSFDAARLPRTLRRAAALCGHGPLGELVEDRDLQWRRSSMPLGVGMRGGGCAECHTAFSCADLPHVFPESVEGRCLAQPLMTRSALVQCALAYLFVLVQLCAMYLRAAQSPLQRAGRLVGQPRRWPTGLAQARGRIRCRSVSLGPVGPRDPSDIAHNGATPQEFRAVVQFGALLATRKAPNTGSSWPQIWLSAPHWIQTSPM